MPRWSCALGALFLCGVVVAGELNGVNLSDEMVIDGNKLILNGLALRTVTRFAIPIKVYVAGLYLTAKNSDSADLIKNNDMKRIVMHFVRPVDRNDLVKAFDEGYEDSCQFNCDKRQEQFHKFSINVVSVRKDNEITLTFYKDKIEINTTGPNAKVQMIEDGDLSRNLLAVFINEKKPPSKDFRAGLLGGK